MYEELLVYSCAQVRIWPFHSRRYRRDSPFDYSQGVSGFRLGRHCSHLLAYARRVLPATFLTSLKSVSVRTFLYIHVTVRSDCATSSDRAILPILLGFVKKENLSIIDR